MLLTIFFLVDMRVFSQDSTRRVHFQDTIFHKVDSLKAAIVTATLRHRLKGDTVEYNTKSFRLQPNANVEQLLGRLPGLQIDNEGNITYNGEKIQHLLVDGEDILGGNLTLVTRNFDASKISHVQVLDRKSDQAVFTAVDDGTRTKTLNLVLKNSAKDGYFGKVELGGNPNAYYNVNAALAAFKNKEQFTAIGLASNTGIFGFSDNAAGALSNVNFVNGISDALGASAGSGVPKFAGAALHYANSWDGLKEHVVGNYQYSRFYTEPVTMIKNLQTEPGGIYRQYQQNQSVNRQNQHWGYGVYDWSPGKGGTFKFTFRGNVNTGQNQFASFGSGSFNGSLVNSSQRRIQDNVSQQTISGEAFWRISIHQAERNLSLGVSFNKVDNSTRGYLHSFNTFYMPRGTIKSIDTVDQLKQISGQPLGLSASISYTEPLWKGALMAVGYSVVDISDKTLQATFARGDGKYQKLVDSLSSHFQTETITQRGLLNLQGNKGKISYTIGTDWISYSLRQNDLLADSTLHQHFVNWTPRVIMNYTVNPATNFRFFYTVFTQQPSTFQLQSTKNNNDPLHLTFGNPSLRPAFNQNFRIEFHRIKDWIINLALDLHLTSNGISNKTETDSSGRQITQPVNVDGGRAASFNFSINRSILGFDAGFHATGYYLRAINYINADLSRNNTYSSGGGFKLSKNVPDKYLLQLNTNITYFDQVSSINIGAPIHYWTQDHYGALTVFLFRNYEFNATAAYSWRQRTSTFTTSTTVFLCNAYIGRNFFHDQLVVKVLVNNILDQNSGISRTSVANVNTEISTNILGRYWMLSAIYHFDRKFKKK